MAKNLNDFDREGQTPLEDLSGLLLELRTRKELDEAEYTNNVKAVAKYLLMNPSRHFNLLAYESLCKIHKDMFGDIWSWAGEKRKTQKSIGVLPAKIGSEIHRLHHDFNQWEDENAPPLEVSAKIHQRLTWIHPFENGNGRWARLVVNIYLHKKGFSLIEWPNHPKIVQETFRPHYLSALRAADKGDFESLSNLHKEYSGQ